MWLYWYEPKRSSKGLPTSTGRLLNRPLSLVRSKSGFMMSETLPTKSAPPEAAVVEDAADVDTLGAVVAIGSA